MIPRITDADALRDFLEHHNIQPSRSMGQNFLTSTEVVDAIIMAAQDGPKTVTELGPGAGAITQALIEHGYTVRAIEKDADFANLLPSLIPAKLRTNLEVVADDLKDIPWNHSKPYQVIGNIPYNISGYIFRTLTQLNPAPTQAILLVQKEVGQRATATAPNMNLLSLSIALWGKATKILNVPRHCFWPQPDIHSQVLLLTPHAPAHMTTQEHEHIMAAAKVFFQQKRKQVGGILRKEFNCSDTQMHNILTEAKVDPNQRPQELTPKQWKILTEAMPQERI